MPSKEASKSMLQTRLQLMRYSARFFGGKRIFATSVGPQEALTVAKIIFQGESRSAVKQIRET
jgi:hypothetical protein